jgi:hypothetical protein
MIFFGTKASTIKNGQIININCPHCETNSSMIYSVFGKYAHIYWIPFFPYKKITLTECTNCKKTFEYKELPENIKTKIDREKERNPVKIPIWMFSGLFILVGIISFGFYNSYQNDINDAEYIKNPKVGDVYYIKMTDREFTTARVDKTTRTEIYLTNNDYIIDLESDIDEIDKNENYTKYKDTISFIQIQEAFKDNLIISIKRE